MTNEELMGLLDFEESLESVEIVNEQECAHDAVFIRAKLQYPHISMVVPFVYYAGQDWVFTPMDWQGWLPEAVDEIGMIRWRVDDTTSEGAVLDGLPMLMPWEPDPIDLKRATRKRIGAAIKKAREQQGVTIRALEVATGVSKGLISRIEGGRYNTTIDTVTLLASRLGLSVDLVVTSEKD